MSDSDDFSDDDDENGVIVVVKNGVPVSMTLQEYKALQNNAPSSISHSDAITDNRAAEPNVTPGSGPTHHDNSGPRGPSISPVGNPSIPVANIEPMVHAQRQGIQQRINNIQIPNDDGSSLSSQITELRIKKEKNPLSSSQYASAIKTERVVCDKIVDSNETESGTSSRIADYGLGSNLNTNSSAQNASINQHATGSSRQNIHDINRDTFINFILAAFRMKKAISSEIGVLVTQLEMTVRYVNQCLGDCILESTFTFIKEMIFNDVFFDSVFKTRHQTWNDMKTKNIFIKILETLSKDGVFDNSNWMLDFISVADVLNKNLKVPIQVDEIKRIGDFRSQPSTRSSSSDSFIDCLYQAVDKEIISIAESRPSTLCNSDDSADLRSFKSELREPNSTANKDCDLKSLGKSVNVKTERSNDLDSNRQIVVKSEPQVEIIDLDSDVSLVEIKQEPSPSIEVIDLISIDSDVIEETRDTFKCKNNQGAPIKTECNLPANPAEKSELRALLDIPFKNTFVTCPTEETFSEIDVGYDEPLPSIPREQSASKVSSSEIDVGEDDVIDVGEDDVIDARTSHQRVPVLNCADPEDINVVDCTIDEENKVPLEFEPEPLPTSTGILGTAEQDTTDTNWKVNKFLEDVQKLFKDDLAKKKKSKWDISKFIKKSPERCKSTGKSPKSPKSPRKSPKSPRSCEKLSDSDNVFPSTSKEIQLSGINRLHQDDEIIPRSRDRLSRSSFSETRSIPKTTAIAELDNAVLESCDKGATEFNEKDSLNIHLVSKDNNEGFVENNDERNHNIESEIGEREGSSKINPCDNIGTPSLVQSEKELNADGDEHEEDNATETVVDKSMCNENDSPNNNFISKDKISVKSDDDKRKPDKVCEIDKCDKLSERNLCDNNSAPSLTKKILTAKSTPSEHEDCANETIVDKGRSQFLDYVSAPSSTSQFDAENDAIRLLPPVIMKKSNIYEPISEPISDGEILDDKDSAQKTNPDFKVVAVNTAVNSESGIQQTPEKLSIGKIPVLKERITLKVKYVPDYTQSEDMKRFFGKHGIVTRVGFSISPGRGRVAYLKFKRRECGLMAIAKENNSLFKGQRISVSEYVEGCINSKKMQVAASKSDTPASNTSDTKISPTIKDPNSSLSGGATNNFSEEIRTININDIPKDRINLVDIFKAFSEFGGIKDLFCPKDDPGEIRGIARIVFEDEESVQAVAEKGVTIKGCRLNIELPNAYSLYQSEKKGLHKSPGQSVFDRLGSRNEFQYRLESRNEFQYRLESRNEFQYRIMIKDCKNRVLTNKVVQKFRTHGKRDITQQPTLVMIGYKDEQSVLKVLALNGKVIDDLEVDVSLDRKYHSFQEMSMLLEKVDGGMKRGFLSVKAPENMMKDIAKEFQTFGRISSISWDSELKVYQIDYMNLKNAVEAYRLKNGTFLSGNKLFVYPNPDCHSLHEFDRVLINDVNQEVSTRSDGDDSIEPGEIVVVKEYETENTSKDSRSITRSKSIDERERKGRKTTDSATLNNERIVRSSSLENASDKKISEPNASSEKKYQPRGEASDNREVIVRHSSSSVVVKEDDAENLSKNRRSKVRSISNDERVHKGRKTTDSGSLKNKRTVRSSSREKASNEKKSEQNSSTEKKSRPRDEASDDRKIIVRHSSSAVAVKEDDVENFSVKRRSRAGSRSNDEQVNKGRKTTDSATLKNERTVRSSSREKASNEKKSEQNSSTEKKSRPRDEASDDREIIVRHSSSAVVVKEDDAENLSVKRRSRAGSRSNDEQVNKGKKTTDSTTLKNERTVRSSSREKAQSSEREIRQRQRRISNDDQDPKGRQSSESDVLRNTKTQRCVSKEAEFSLKGSRVFVKLASNRTFTRNIENMFRTKDLYAFNAHDKFICVEYMTNESLRKALSLNGFKIDDRQLFVTLSSTVSDKKTAAILKTVNWTVKPGFVVVECPKYLNCEMMKSLSSIGSVTSFLWIEGERLYHASFMDFNDATMACKVLNNKNLNGYIIRVHLNEDYNSLHEIKDSSKQKAATQKRPLNNDETIQYLEGLVLESRKKKSDSKPTPNKGDVEKVRHKSDSHKPKPNPSHPEAEKSDSKPSTYKGHEEKVRHKSDSNKPKPSLSHPKEVVIEIRKQKTDLKSSSNKGHKKKVRNKSDSHKPKQIISHPEEVVIDLGKHKSDLKPSPNKGHVEKVRHKSDFYKPKPSPSKKLTEGKPNNGKTTSTSDSDNLDKMSVLPKFDKVEKHCVDTAPNKSVHHHMEKEHLESGISKNPGNNDETHDTVHVIEPYDPSEPTADSPNDNAVPIINPFVDLGFTPAGSSSDQGNMHIGEPLNIPSVGAPIPVLLSRVDWLSGIDWPSTPLEPEVVETTEHSLPLQVNRSVEQKENALQNQASASFEYNVINLFEINNIKNKGYAESIVVCGTTMQHDINRVLPKFRDLGGTLVYSNKKFLVFRCNSQDSVIQALHLNGEFIDSVQVAVSVQTPSPDVRRNILANVSKNKQPGNIKVIPRLGKDANFYHRLFQRLNYGFCFPYFEPKRRRSAIFFNFMRLKDAIKVCLELDGTVHDGITVNIKPDLPYLTEMETKEIFHQVKTELKKSKTNSTDTEPSTQVKPTVIVNTVNSALKCKAKHMVIESVSGPITDKMVLTFKPTQKLCCHQRSSSQKLFLKCDTLPSQLDALELNGKEIHDGRQIAVYPDPYSFSVKEINTLINLTPRISQQGYIFFKVNPCVRKDFDYLTVFKKFGFITNFSVYENRIDVTFMLLQDAVKAYVAFDGTTVGDEGLTAYADLLYASSKRLMDLARSEKAAKSNTGVSVTDTEITDAILNTSAVDEGVTKKDLALSAKMNPQFISSKHPKVPVEIITGCKTIDMTKAPVKLDDPNISKGTSVVKSMHDNAWSTSETVTVGAINVTNSPTIEPLKVPDVSTSKCKSETAKLQTSTKFHVKKTIKIIIDKDKRIGTDSVANKLVKTVVKKDDLNSNVTNSPIIEILKVPDVSTSKCKSETANLRTSTKFHVRKPIKIIIDKDKKIVTDSVANKLGKTVVKKDNFNTNEEMIPMIAKDLPSAKSSKMHTKPISIHSSKEGTSTAIEGMFSNDSKRGAEPSEPKDNPEVVAKGMVPIDKASNGETNQRNSKELQNFLGVDSKCVCSQQHIIVESLTGTITEQVIAEFSKIGNICTKRIPFKNGRLFLTCSYLSSQISALRLNGKCIDGVQVAVYLDSSFAKGDGIKLLKLVPIENRFGSLIVQPRKGLHYEEADYIRMFGKFGHIVNFFVKNDSNSAYVTFMRLADAVAAYVAYKNDDSEINIFPNSFYNTQSDLMGKGNEIKVVGKGNELKTGGKVKYECNGWNYISPGCLSNAMRSSFYMMVQKKWILVAPVKGEYTPNILKKFVDIDNSLIIIEPRSNSNNKFFLVHYDSNESIKKALSLNDSIIDSILISTFVHACLSDWYEYNPTLCKNIPLSKRLGALIVKPPFMHNRDFCDRYGYSLTFPISTSTSTSVIFMSIKDAAKAYLDLNDRYWNGVKRTVEPDGFYHSTFEFMSVVKDNTTPLRNRSVEQMETVPKNQDSASVKFNVIDISEIMDINIGNHSESIIVCAVTEEHDIYRVLPKFSDLGGTLVSSKKKFLVVKYNSRDSVLQALNLNGEFIDSVQVAVSVLTSSPGENILASVRWHKQPGYVRVISRKCPQFYQRLFLRLGYGFCFPCSKTKDAIYYVFMRLKDAVKACIELDGSTHNGIAVSIRPEFHYLTKKETKDIYDEVKAELWKSKSLPNEKCPDTSSAVTNSSLQKQTDIKGIGLNLITLSDQSIRRFHAKGRAILVIATKGKYTPAILKKFCLLDGFTECRESLLRTFFVIRYSNINSVVRGLKWHGDFFDSVQIAVFLDISSFDGNDKWRILKGLPHHQLPGFIKVTAENDAQVSSTFNADMCKRFGFCFPYQEKGGSTLFNFMRLDDAARACIELDGTVFDKTRMSVKPDFGHLSENESKILFESIKRESRKRITEPADKCTILDASKPSVVPPTLTVASIPLPTTCDDKSSNPPKGAEGVKITTTECLELDRTTKPSKSNNNSKQPKSPSASKTTVIDDVAAIHTSASKPSVVPPSSTVASIPLPTTSDDKSRKRITEPADKCTNPDASVASKSSNKPRQPKSPSASKTTVIDGAAAIQTSASKPSVVTPTSTVASIPLPTTSDDKSSNPPKGAEGHKTTTTECLELDLTTKPSIQKQEDIKGIDLNLITLSDQSHTRLDTRGRALLVLATSGGYTTAILKTFCDLDGFTKYKESPKKNFFIIRYTNMDSIYRGIKLHGEFFGSVQIAVFLDISSFNGDEKWMILRSLPRDKKPGIVKVARDDNKSFISSSFYADMCTRFGFCFPYQKRYGTTHINFMRLEDAVRACAELDGTLFNNSKMSVKPDFSHLTENESKTLFESVKNESPADKCTKRNTVPPTSTVATIPLPSTSDYKSRNNPQGAEGATIASKSPNHNISIKPLLFSIYSIGGKPISDAIIDKFRELDQDCNVVQYSSTEIRITYTTEDAELKALSLNGTSILGNQLAVNIGKRAPDSMSSALYKKVSLINMPGYLIVEPETKGGCDIKASAQVVATMLRHCGWNKLYLGAGCWYVTFMFLKDSYEAYSYFNGIDVEKVGRIIVRPNTKIHRTEAFKTMAEYQGKLISQDSGNPSTATKCSPAISTKRKLSEPLSDHPSKIQRESDGSGLVKLGLAVQHNSAMKTDKVSEAAPSAVEKTTVQKGKLPGILPSGNVPALMDSAPYKGLEPALPHNDSSPSYHQAKKYVDIEVPDTGKYIIVRGITGLPSYPVVSHFSNLGKFEKYLLRFEDGYFAIKYADGNAIIRALSCNGMIIKGIKVAVFPFYKSFLQETIKKFYTKIDLNNRPGAIIIKASLITFRDYLNHTIFSKFGNVVDAYSNSRKSTIILIYSSIFEAVRAYNGLNGMKIHDSTIKVDPVICFWTSKEHFQQIVADVGKTDTENATCVTDTEHAKLRTNAITNDSRSEKSELDNKKPIDVAAPNVTESIDNTKYEDVQKEADKRRTDGKSRLHFDDDILTGYPNGNFIIVKAVNVCITDEIVNHFSKIGLVKNTEYPMIKSYFFIEYKDEDSIGKALLSNGKIVNGNQVGVLFHGSLHKRMKWYLHTDLPNDIRPGCITAFSKGNVFSKSFHLERFKEFGCIISASRISDNSLSVNYMSIRDAERACKALNVTSINNLPINIYFNSAYHKLSQDCEDKKIILEANQKGNSAEADDSFSKDNAKESTHTEAVPDATDEVVDVPKIVKKTVLGKCDNEKTVTVADLDVKCSVKGELCVVKGVNHPITDSIIDKFRNLGNVGRIVKFKTMKNFLIEYKKKESTVKALELNATVIYGVQVGVFPFKDSFSKSDTFMFYQDLSKRKLIIPGFLIIKPMSLTSPTTSLTWVSLTLLGKFQEYGLLINAHLTKGCLHLTYLTLTQAINAYKSLHKNWVGNAFLSIDVDTAYHYSTVFGQKDKKEKLNQIESKSDNIATVVKTDSKPTNTSDKTPCVVQSPVKVGQKRKIDHELANTSDAKLPRIIEQTRKTDPGKSDRIGQKVKIETKSDKAPVAKTDSKSTNTSVKAPGIVETESKPTNTSVKTPGIVETKSKPTNTSVKAPGVVRTESKPTNTSNALLTPKIGQKRKIDHKIPKTSAPAMYTADTLNEPPTKMKKDDLITLKNRGGQVVKMTAKQFDDWKRRRDVKKKAVSNTHKTVPSTSGSASNTVPMDSKISTVSAVSKEAQPNDVLSKPVTGVTDNYPNTSLAGLPVSDNSSRSKKPISTVRPFVHDTETNVPKESPGRWTIPTDPAEIIVTELPNWNETRVKQEFQRFGVIKNVEYSVDNDRGVKVFLKILYESEKDAKGAVKAMNGKVIISPSAGNTISYRKEQKILCRSAHAYFNPGN